MTDEVSNKKPDGSNRKEFAKNGSMSIVPTPEELRKWENGGKQAIHKAIKENHLKMQKFVEKRNGEVMYTDKRGNS